MIFQGLTGNSSVVPVVMFHSVGGESLDWVFNYISEPIARFEEKVKALSEGGFHFITWSQLYAYMRGESSLQLPAILLTFDDGYLDNWVYAAPILKKYGARGTIFVSSDFVDPSTQVRPTLEDVQAGRCEEDSLDISGFLNWEEMRQMESSGVMDIQSHAASHTWYFSNSKVVDFWTPSVRDYPWMAWNTRPDRKPFYMCEDQNSLVRLGTPIYEYEKSLCVFRYLPSTRITEELAAYVDLNKSEKFFSDPNWHGRLLMKHEEIFAEFEDDCRYETHDERRHRTRIELSQSKQALEENLLKKIDFICWPGGAYDQLTLEEAKAVGYKAWTLGSSDQSAFRNIPGADAQQVKRIGSSIKQIWNGKELGYTSGEEFYSGVRRHQGSAYYKWTGRALKAVRIVRSLV